MSTGLTSLSKLPEIGAAYPFAGFEMVFVGFLVAFFLYFFARQIAIEHAHYKSIKKTYASTTSSAAPSMAGLAPAE
jgi:hypothetical protein